MQIIMMALTITSTYPKIIVKVKYNKINELRRNKL